VSCHPIWNQDEFIERYTQLKNQHLLDIEIAKEMFINKNTLYRYKKRYGVALITKENRELVNENGLTREWLNIAQKNGLTSSQVNARIREHHWSVEDACMLKSLPRGTKLMKKGERING
jgi:hypothetical protein